MNTRQTYLLLWQVMNNTITKQLSQAVSRLNQQNRSLPAELKTDTRLEAEVLLAFTLQKPRSFLRAHPEAVLSTEQSREYHSHIERRVDGEPVAYITGHREFWSLELITNKHTLIPRPETEILVEHALSLIPENGKFLIADLGTGTGAIALAIAKERPHCQVIATDISEHTLDVARQNAARNNIKNVKFICGDWFNAFEPASFSNSFDFIVSNPPYIAHSDEHLGMGDLRYEPDSALSSGVDGLDAINSIIKTATRFLSENAFLIIEHGHEQREKITSILQSMNYENIAWHDDLNGLARVLVARKFSGSKKHG